MKTRRNRTRTTARTGMTGFDRHGDQGHLPGCGQQARGENRANAAYRMKHQGRTAPTHHSTSQHHSTAHSTAQLSALSSQLSALSTPHSVTQSVRKVEVEV